MRACYAESVCLLAGSILVETDETQHAQPVSYPSTDGVSMDPPETISFVIKIWLEETAEEAQGAVWRGHITHVPSGERRYLRDLDDITAFVASYLDGMGVKFGVRWRVRQWLNRWKLHLIRRG